MNNESAFLFNDFDKILSFLALVLFPSNTAKYSTYEDKQTESSRIYGVDYSVLVLRAGHLAVTRWKDK